MNLKAIIVDDEEDARKLLKLRLLKHHPQLEVLDTCENAKDALLSVIKNKPDVIFLDIQMPGMSGLEFFEGLSVINFPIQAIITSAFSEPEFYKKAIRLGLTDYLLKPIVQEELDAAIDNVKSRISSKNHLNQVNNILTVLTTENKISLSSGSSKIFIHPGSIVYANSDGKYSHMLFTNGEELTIMHGIGELAELLSSIEFYKIDRFTIVNLNYIQKISPRLKLLVFEFNNKLVQLKVSHAGAVNLMSKMSFAKENVADNDPAV
jgi:two-component system, LytTR family, response regulator